MTTRPKIPIDTSKGWDMCFGCGKENPIGLKLKVEQEGKTVKAEFTPNEHHQGWSGIVHGGIITTLLDEAMGYAALSENVCCVTAKMQAKFKRPALINEPLIITGSVAKNEGKLLETKAAVSLTDGTLVAEGTATMFVLGQMPDSTNNNEERPKNNAQK